MPTWRWRTGALLVLDTVVPSALLLDLDLPHVTGLEVAGRARTAARLTGLPIARMSGWAAGAAALAAGCDAFLGKPLRAHEPTAQIRAVLERPSAG